MEKLTVNVPYHEYDIHIGKAAYELFKTEYAEILQSADQIAIFADELVASIHLPLLEKALEAAGHHFHVKMIPSGEQCKTPEVFLDCCTFLMQNGFSRNSLIIAFGGGACGDLSGFVAATFMRGIRYIHCPTTLLAHDSAVGGKTAINLPEGKNLLGSFYQPSGVLFDVDVFKTLPIREVRSGMAELLKHAYISNQKWTEDLLMNETFLSPTEDWLAAELRKGISVKASIVAQDEFELDIRKHLNFGHTFGHAVEAVCGFGGLSHGESIMIGMAYSLVLSESLGSITQQQTNELIQFALKNEYTFQPIYDDSFETFMNYMKRDKKSSFGKIHFVLLQQIGFPFSEEVSREQLEEAFNELRRRLG